MTDDTPQPEPAAVPATRPRHRAVWRWSRRFSGVVLAVIAASFVTSLSINLGPSLRGLAARGATAYLKRPMHIGALSARLNLGEFELDDIVIEGLTPADVPFLVAKKVTVYVPWWTIFGRDLIIEDVHMTGWSMHIDAFADGRTSTPRLVPDPSASPLPAWMQFTKTTRLIHTDDGTFTYDDHGTPWSVIARHLSVNIVRSRGEYRGTANFSEGTVQIQKYQPMSADLNTSFRIDGPIVRLERILLRTDGAVSHVNGMVDFDRTRFPEMTFDVDSRVDFRRMRDLFWHDFTFELEGNAGFKGRFHVFKGGRELAGTFTSDLAGIQTANWGTYRFPHLDGSLVWTRDRFDVLEARSEFHGGRMNQIYSLAPLGRPATPAIATWDVQYDDVDLKTFGEALHWPVIQLDGRITGRNVLTWPNGRFHERHGDGEIVGMAPAGVALAPKEIPAGATLSPAEKSFDRAKPYGAMPTGGHVTYHWAPEWIDVDDSWVASPATYLQLHGRTAYFEDTEMPFHLTSTDWLESDRVLVAVMGTFHASASAIDIGGYGTFDGEMTSTFKAPHIEGRFAAASIRAWDVVWGRAEGDATIDHHYVTIRNGVVHGAEAGSRIDADGKYSLGFPRDDDGDEIDGSIHLTKWPIADLRVAFKLTDWPIDGTASADLRLYGAYEYPSGYGGLHIDNGKAWGETFQVADGRLRFEPSAIHIDDVTMAKGTGAITGAAQINWDGTYSFSADGQRIPVDAMTRLTVASASLTGLLQFTATGAGAFASPQYEVRGSIADLYTGDEGIGQVTGDLVVENNVVSFTKLNIASSRLAVAGSGRIALTADYDADFTLRFTDMSIDPYLRLLAPQVYSPYFSAQLNGLLRVHGAMVDQARLAMDLTVDTAQLRLFDYDLHNRGPIHLSLDHDVVTAKANEFILEGDQTSLDLSGTLSLGDSRINLHAGGAANLAVLQGFLRDVRSSGQATLSADLTGNMSGPTFSGYADITGGRLRSASAPSLDEINGRVDFDRDAISLDLLHGKLGGGDVTFGGRIGFKGYMPDQFDDVRATGENMRVSYPTDFQSVVNAELTLSGPRAAPRLTGLVTVVRTKFTRQFEAGAGLYGLFVASDSGAAAGDEGSGEPAAAAFPVEMDVRIVAPPMSFVDDKDLRLNGTATLRVTGTPGHLVVTGSVEAESGFAVLLGNTYRVTGGSITFTNPQATQALFDLEAETTVRIPALDVLGSLSPAQSYRIRLRVTGAKDRLVPTCESDPPLPTVDCLSLLLGETTNLSSAEIRALGAPQQAAGKLAEQFLGQLAASALYSSSGVGRVVEKISGVDTIQITPFFSNESAFQNVSAGARITLGERISDRVYLTYSRAVGSLQSELILLEYDQNDRIQWIISRNEDSSFAIDFRIRHRF